MKIKDLIKKIIPYSVLDFYHFLLPMLGAFLYRFPTRNLLVIGITGTNGKSTVVDLTTKILEEADYKTASLSSIKFKIGEKEWKNTLKMTMPGRMKLQKFLRKAVNAGCKYAVLEITSEGIKQHRHRFIDFDVAVFTNLTPEHIESHGNFENYRAAKGKLFQATKNIHIINIDDENAEYFLQFPAAKKILYGLKDKSTLLHGIKLLGEFNVYNALAAIQVGLSQGIDLEICQRAIENTESVPGRMEVVIREPFMVVVDYAHTPDALQKVYQAIQDSKLICVFGAAGGGRDKWKRPEMGKIAAQYCDQIILTNEDPYDEAPGQILENIEEGILKIKNSKLNKNLKLKIKNYQKMLDRREAIRKALNLVRPGDTVIITGKGCEPWMCVEGGRKILWDDREIVKETLRQAQDKTEK